ncbi:MAG: DUF5779 family protein [Halobacteriales archaeon]
MSDFGLDLGAIEEEIEDPGGRRIVLGVLDGETPDEEWLAQVEAGNALVLAVEGDLERRAEGIAPPIRDAGGSVVHFRGFLVVTPPDIEVDTDRL